MKKLLSTAAVAVALLTCIECAQAEDIDFAALAPQPRLFLNKGAEKALLQNLTVNKEMARVHEAVIECADEIIPMPPLERIQEGKRLLPISQDVLRRVFFLSYAYRTTGSAKYAKRAELEMLNASNFRDWNPPHFLDTAEMTAALAIGIDWLSDAIDKNSRAKIEAAIVEKGLLESLKPAQKGIFVNQYNWNSVCNAGMLLGAIAVFESNEELAKKIISRATAGLPIVAKHSYEPNGSYPEGYMYWNYGTSFQVIACAALESAFGGDAGLSKAKGFLESAYFVDFMGRPSQTCFNFADCTSPLISSPALFWFAKKLNDDSVLQTQKIFHSPSLPFHPQSELTWQDRNGEKIKYKEFSRLLPLMLVYGSDVDFSKVKQSEKKLWRGEGVSPVVAVKTDGTPNALYLGIKGGRGDVGHAHLDAGSFVFDADGVDWAIDLGAENYHALEVNKVNLWGYKNGGDRWKVFKYSNRAHNTITIDDAEHISNSYCPIETVFDTDKKRGATLDLSPALANKVKSAKREAVVIDGEYAQITDIIETSENSVLLRWNMCTCAAPKLIADKNSIVLTKNGKSLTLSIESDEDVELKTWSAKPARDFEAQNDGATFVGFECKIPAQKIAVFKIKLAPQSAK